MALIWNMIEVEYLLHSTNGPLGKYLATKSALVETAAKARCPVDTGRLRSSINWRVETRDGALCGVIGASAEYARFVHDGARGRPPRPFLAEGLQTVMGSNGGWSPWSDK